MRGASTCEALLLRSSNRGEDDRLLTLLTPDHGRVTALARHARGSRRRFGAALEPFRRLEAALRPGDGGLFFLNSAHVLETPLGGDPGLESLAAAWLCLELGAAFALEGHPQPDLFELLLGGLRRLGRAAEGPSAVRQSVLWGALSQAGWAPGLERCGVCGSEGPWSRVGLDPARGGLVCGGCAGSGSRALPGEALEHWKALAQGLPSGPGPARAEGFLLRWTEYHLGGPLRSAALLGSDGEAP